MAIWLRFTLYSIFGATLILLGLAAYKAPAARSEAPQVPIAMMLEQLDDKSPLVRGWAVRALSPHVDGNATVDAAIARLLSDPDPTIRAIAAKALGISTGETVDAPVEGLPALPIPGLSALSPSVFDSTGREDVARQLNDDAEEPAVAPQQQQADSEPATEIPTTDLAENTNPGTERVDAASNAIVAETETPSVSTPLTGDAPPDTEQIAAAPSAAGSDTEGATGALSYMQWLIYGLLALLGLWLLTIFVVALVSHYSPLTILRWDNNLKDNRLLANLTLIAPLARSLKIQKAWVAEAAPLLKERMAALPVMAKNSALLDVPIKLDKTQRSSLEPQDLKGVFTDPSSGKGPGVLSVTGMAGAGSSTIARQIVSWMLERPEDFTRSGDQMLAVLLDEDVHLRGRQTQEGTIQAVTEQLSRLLDHDPQVTPDFVRSLLKNHLLLVALDRQNVGKDISVKADPNHSVVIFNRPPGKLPGNTPVLSAMTLSGEELESFMDRYFAENGQPEGLSDKQKSDARKDLAAMTGEDVPVQIATMYTDRLLAGMHHHFRSRDTSQLAVLITDHVRVRNLDAAGPALPEGPLLEAAKSMAWACYERDLKQTWIKANDSRRVVGGEDPRRYTQHLDQGLDILEVCHPDYETVGLRFRSSLIATYLAAWHVAEAHKNNLHGWEPLMNRLIDMEGEERPTMFLKALDDVFSASEDQWTMPFEVRKTVKDMLEDSNRAIPAMEVPTRRAETDSPRREVPVDSPLVDMDDDKVSSENAGSVNASDSEKADNKDISPARKAARAGLAGAATAAATLTATRSSRNTIEDSDRQVMSEADDSVTYVRSDDMEIDSPATVDADDDLQTEGDWLAGTPGPEVPETEDVVNEHLDLGTEEIADDVSALMRGSELDPVSLNSYIERGVDAVPALMTFLKRGDSDTRRLAAKGLAAIGPDAKEAIPVLADALKDDDSAVRTSAAEALYHLGTPDVNGTSDKAS